MDKKKRKLQWFFLFLLFGSASLVYPQISRGDTWAKTFGKGDAKYFSRSVLETGDGGYILAASAGTQAIVGDAVVLKLDGTGKIQWQKSYSNSPIEAVLSIRKTMDAGYILVGFTGGPSNIDCWVLKLDGAGNHVWHKTYGGIGGDLGYAIEPTADGGYIVAAATTSFGASVMDLWLLKLNSTGGVQWQKRYGSTLGEIATDIGQTADGGYIVAGVIGQPGLGDIWLLKLDPLGSLQWQKTYSDVADDFVISIDQTATGGYILAGFTESFGAGDSDILVMALDASGGVQWQKTYGGAHTDRVSGMVLTSDGGYVISGTTESFGVGGEDMWLLKLDASGEILWQRSYGTVDDQFASGLQQTADGGYMVVGGNREDNEIRLLKTHRHGEIASCDPGMIKHTDAIVGSAALSVGSVTPLTVATTTAIPGGGITAVGSLAIETSEDCAVAEPFIPLPTGQDSYSYYPVQIPLEGIDPELILPVAVGDVLGGEVDITVGLFETAGPMDIYFAIAAPLLTSEIYLLTLDKGFQPFSTVGLSPWKTQTQDYIYESLSGKLSTSIFPTGIYYLYLVITPAGSQEAYYTWSTHFVIH